MDYISKATFEILEDRIEKRINEFSDAAESKRFPNDIEEDLPWN